MARSQWHKFYAASIAAPPETLFRLLSDLPNYPDWLPGSAAYGQTTDVEPYPVRRGSRYHDGKPGEAGKDWWGTVTGFHPPGSVDFQHTIRVAQLMATVDVHIHYSLEAANGVTTVTRWLVLDVTMPAVFRPLRSLITASFDKENVRTMAALKAYAETRTAALAGTASWTRVPAPEIPSVRGRGWSRMVGATLAPWSQAPRVPSATCTSPRRT